MSIDHRDHNELPTKILDMQRRVTGLIQELLMLRDSEEVEEGQWNYAFAHLTDAEVAIGRMHKRGGPC